jgi:dienelactone hydrolase
MVTRQAGDGALMNLTVYPDARHSFAEPDHMAPSYNEKAAEDSLRRAREFLARNVKG